MAFKDNMRGEAKWCAKLGADKVRAIRADTRQTKILATIYGVDRSLIQKIRRRAIWAHVK